MHNVDSLLRNVRTPAPTRGTAILAKGFRPFFLLASLFAGIAMPFWVGVLHGHVATNQYFPGPLWHAHEMLFGFAVAVIGGFLLTAVGNWTQRETAVGAGLAFLCLLWAAGRVVIALADRLPRGAVAATDLAFLPALAVACARPIVGTKNARNYAFVAMLVVLALANGAMHAGAMRWITPNAMRVGAAVGVDVAIAMILVMTTRIVPMFTRNATGRETIQNEPMLDRAAIALALIAMGTDIAPLDRRISAIASAAAAVAVLARARRWGSRHTLRNPLLWVLHVGHAFVAVGFVLRALEPWWPRATPSASLHAMTAGAIGTLTLGMMARVALGHTGRTLTVRPAMSVGFASVVAATVLRILGAMVPGRGYLHVMAASGVLFALGFVIYAIVYAPVVFAPRVDGKPG